MSADMLRTLKRSGFSDRELGPILGADEDAVRAARMELGLKAAYKRIDTCAAEFESFTPYLYGTYETECEADPTPRQKVVILGSGPNRIGQGIEFDYCCCHAAFALREEGFETVMVNCNPETVSTDYDTVDRLYFEPLTFEDVSAIIAREQDAGAEVSCVVQYGGQTPLKLALPLQAAGIKIIGTSPDSIDLAEDRQRFAQLLWDLGIPQAPSGTAMTPEEARDVAEKIGFPLVVAVPRPRRATMYRLRHGGARSLWWALSVSPGHRSDRQVPRGCGRARRRCGSRRSGRGGHRRHHGHRRGRVHSGDSSCVIPPPRWSIGTSR
jgi:carbamoyl-phosphate synthase large subunit